MYTGVSDNDFTDGWHEAEGDHRRRADDTAAVNSRMRMGLIILIVNNTCIRNKVKCQSYLNFLNGPRIQQGIFKSLAEILTRGHRDSALLNYFELMLLTDH